MEHMYGPSPMEDLLLSSGRARKERKTRRIRPDQPECTPYTLWQLRENQGHHVYFPQAGDGLAGLPTHLRFFAPFFSGAMPTAPNRRVFGSIQVIAALGRGARDATARNQVHMRLCRLYNAAKPNLASQWLR